MPYVPNLDIFDQIKTKADFDRINEEIQLRRMKAQAELAASASLDMDKVGEKAIVDILQGKPVSERQIAAAQFVNSKTGGVGINPGTWEPYQKPTMFQKLGLSEIAAMTSEPSPFNTPNRQPVVNPPAGPADTVDVTQIPQVDASLVGGGQSVPARGSYGLPAAPANSVTQRQKAEFGGERAKADSKTLDAIDQNIESARSLVSKYDNLKQLRKEAGWTGFGGSALLTADRVGEAFGLPNVVPGTVGAKEAVLSLKTDEWQSKISPLKGALSDREGARFDQVSSGLDTSERGIELRGRLSKQILDRATKQREFYTNYIQRYGSLDGPGGNIPPATVMWQGIADKVSPVDLDSAEKYVAEKAEKAKKSLSYNPKTGGFE